MDKVFQIWNTFLVEDVLRTTWSSTRNLNQDHNPNSLEEYFMATLTPGKWTLDTSHSEAMFSVRHAGISRVRGNFEDFSGNAEFTENLDGSVIQAEVMAASEIGRASCRERDRT